jgi:hypothetical protein
MVMTKEVTNGTKVVAKVIPLPIAKRESLVRIGKDFPLGILFGNRKAGQRTPTSAKNDIEG